MAVRTVSMSISLKIEQKAKILKFAKKKKMPASEIVRNAIDEYLDRSES